MLTLESFPQKSVSYCLLCLLPTLSDLCIVHICTPSFCSYTRDSTPSDFAEHSVGHLVFKMAAHCLTVLRCASVYSSPVPRSPTISSALGFFSLRNNTEANMSERSACSSDLPAPSHHCIPYRKTCSMRVHRQASSHRTK